MRTPAERPAAGRKAHARHPGDEWVQPFMNRFPGRLNVFQATMLEWRDHHPYTAVHALRLPILPPDDALAAAIHAELRALGVGLLELDRRHRRYAWRDLPAAVHVARVPGGDDTGALHGCLEREIERQMNTPFPIESVLDPFRFFTIPAAQGGYLGLAYDHFIAGGDSIVRLMNRIAARLAGTPHPAVATALYPSTHWPLFLRHPLRVARAVTHMPAMVRSCRRTLRPRYRDITEGRNGFMLHRLHASDLDALVRCATRWSVTFNDLLIALLLLARDVPTRSRLEGTRRRELAAASIMNLRAFHSRAAGDAFGQFLGSFRVSHPVPPGIGLETLVHDVHRDTVRIKHRHLYLAGLIAMRADQVLARFQTPRQRMSVYAKGYPVNAGTSTLNVDVLWRSDVVPVPEYLRGVPTGPLAPMVLAATTAGGEVWAGMSYRTAAFERAEVDAIWTDMLTRIRELP